MSLLYRWKVQFLKTPRGNFLWRRWQARQGRAVGAYDDLKKYIREHAPGGSFADIGCMWGVDGAYAFLAEEAGATAVKGVDVFGPTPEFEAEHRRRGSRVAFILGDILRADTLDAVGAVDTVLCAGVLYHLPNPFDLLAALRRVCRRTLILRTSTIPEMAGLPQAAVYYPMLDPAARELWTLRSLGLMTQVGITDGFQPGEGYGNWFWGLTPSAVEAMLATAGFRVDVRAFEAFAHTVICTAVAPPIDHRLPGIEESRSLAAEISKAGIARPA
jgi:SAM-dependent methyltransferase